VFSLKFGHGKSSSINLFGICSMEDCGKLKNSDFLTIFNIFIVTYYLLGVLFVFPGILFGTLKKFPHNSDTGNKIDLHL